MHHGRAQNRIKRSTPGKPAKVGFLWKLAKLFSIGGKAIRSQEWPARLAEYFEKERWAIHGNSEKRFTEQVVQDIASAVAKSVMPKGLKSIINNS